MRNRDRADGGNLTARMSHWASVGATDSPLYGAIGIALADDPTVLAILGEAPEGLPAPLNLFAAVHYLLAMHPEDPLAAHYPSIAGRDATAQGDAPPLFKDFCERHVDELTGLVATRGVQTNEVLRCAILLPAFAVVAEQSAAPLWLIELGPSAGLNLLFDRYRFDYGPLGTTGREESTLTLTPEIRSGTPPVPDPLPAVAGRIGVDLNPVDPFDADAVAWQRALIWPESKERFTRLDTALAVARQDPPPVIRGDAVVELPNLLDGVPADATPLVYHSFALNQIPEEGRQVIQETLLERSQERTIHRVSMEMPGPVSLLVHTRYENGEMSETELGKAHFHGKWLEWRNA
jgi:hypothetical protein